MLNGPSSSVGSTNNPVSLLLAAISDGNEEIVRSILNSSERPPLEDIKNESAQPNLLILGIHSPAIVDALLDAYSEISTDKKISALLYSASLGYTQTTLEIFIRCPDIPALYKAYALEKAARAGHAQTVIELFKIYWREDLTYSEKVMYISNIIRFPTVLVQLLTHCGISNKDKGIALTVAAEGSNLQSLKELLIRCNGEISNDDKDLALQHAVRYGHSPIIAELLIRCNGEISNDNKGRALENSARYGHSPIIVELLIHCNGEISNNYKGIALVNAVKYGHPAIIMELLIRCGNEISTNDKVSALKWSIIYGNLAALNSLLADPSVEALATHNNNEALIEAQMRLNGDDEDRARYQPIVDRLMQIPAVAALAAALAPQTNLAHIAQFGENSMQSLNAKEQGVLSHLKNHYKSIYEEKGFEVIRAEILSYLEESYKKSPALDNGNPLPLEYTANLSQTALQSYYKHLNHGAWRYLSDSNPWMAANAEWIHTFEDGRKVAIISDADKELMSYIWIALNDETVKLEDGFAIEGNKNVFAQNLGELNRAHNHDERAEDPLEQQAYLDKIPGIKTTRVDDFEADKPTCVYGVTKRLLESPYGHPHIKPLDPKLMQNWMEALLFGRKEKPEHPDNIVDRLDKLSLDELKNIQVNLIDAMSGEPFECHNALQIPKQQLDAFIEKVKTWYGADEIAQEKNPKLVINPAGSGFIAEKHNSYMTLIQFCAKDPINCFAAVLNTYLTSRIQELAQVHDVNMENANLFVPSYDDSKKREHEDEPDTGVKFRRLV